MEQPQPSPPENPFPEAKPAPPRPGPPRLRVQFTLTGLFVLTVGSALIFGAFKLLGLSPQASLFVTGLIACALLAGGALVAAIAKSAGDDRD